MFNFKSHVFIINHDMLRPILIPILVLILCFLEKFHEE